MKRYNIIQQEEESLKGQNDFAEKNKRPLDFYDKMEKLGEWLWIKVQAVFWISAAIGIIYYSNFFRQLFHNPNINELFLTLAMLFIGINISLAIYTALVLPYILGIHEDIEVYNPKAIQIGAFSGFMSFLTMVIAIWPVFGWLSVPMLFALFLGFLNTGHFLPNNQLSGLLFGGIFIGAFFSHYLIDHDGYLH